MTSHRRIWAFPRRRRIWGGSTPSIVRRTGSNWLTPVYPPHEIVRRLPNNWGVNPPLTWFPYILAYTLGYTLRALDTGVWLDVTSGKPATELFLQTAHILTYLCVLGQDRPKSKSESFKAKFSIWLCVAHLWSCRNQYIFSPLSE